MQLPLPATKPEPGDFPELKTPPTDLTEQDSDSDSENDDQNTSYGNKIISCKMTSIFW